MDDSVYLVEIGSYLSENKCDISKLFKNIEIWSKSEKHSVSNTVIVEAEIKMSKELSEYENYNNTVIIKIQVKKKLVYSKEYKSVDILKGGIDNSLTVEKQIYEYLQIFAIDNISPNIIGYLGYFECKELSFGEEVLEQLNIRTEDVDSFGLLILRKSNGIPLYKFFDSIDIQEIDIVKILFQIIYTLKCFENIKLIHNDLHAGNILVEILDDEEQLNYSINGPIYSFYTKYIVKIYDFDRASIPRHNIERNLLLNYWEYSDVPIAYNVYKNADLFHLLTTLIGRNSTLDEDLLYRFVKNKKLELSYKLPNYRIIEFVDINDEKHFDDVPYPSFFKLKGHILVNEQDANIIIEQNYNVHIHNISKTNLGGDVQAFKFILLNQDENKIIKSLDDCLNMVIKYMKDEIEKNNKKVRREDCYTFNTKIVVKSWNPILDEVFTLKNINKYKEFDQSQILYEVYNISNIFILQQYYNFDYDKIAQELINKTKEEAKINIKIPNEWITLSCYLLTSPYWHSFGSETRTKIVYYFSAKIDCDPDMLFTAINLVWYKHDLKLPISIPLL